LYHSLGCEPNLTYFLVLTSKILESNILKLSTKTATKSIETLSIQEMNPRKATGPVGSNTDIEFKI